MRTIIYGAGGIGSVVGGHLVRTGQEVILIGRPGHVDAINQKGLKLITPVGTHHLRIPAVTSPEQIAFQPDDVVFLTMKSQNTEEALKTLKKCVNQIPIVCIQNGVRNEELAAGLFDDVYGSTVRIGAVYMNDGEVIAHNHPAGWLIMGRYPKGTDTIIETIATQLRKADIYVMVTPEVMRYKWSKLMRNIRSAVGAITDAGHTDCKALNELVRREAHDLLVEAGITYVTDAQIAEEWPEFNNKPPKFAGGGEPQNSTWQSLARKVGSVENEFFNGEIARLAKKLGKKAPINDGINRIIQDMAAKRQTPGTYTIADLKKILVLT